jgi:hypothetical protein
MKNVVVTQHDMHQKRLRRMAKGVVAAAKAIDDKFHDELGYPEFVKTKSGKVRYSRFSPYRCALVTLTYAQDDAWDAKHIAALVKNYREWFRRNGKGTAFHYVWTLELTEQGRPHYHMVIWLPFGVKPPLPDAQGWWSHGMTQAKYAVSPVGYIAKYASKTASKTGATLPPGARLWGYGGLKMDERGPVAYALAPRWVKRFAHVNSHPVKRVFERVEKVIQYSCGFVHEQVVRKAGWLLKCGEMAGWRLFSAYEFDTLLDRGSIALRSSGVIELLSPEGDSFQFKEA